MNNSEYFYNAVKRDLSMVRGDTMSFAFQLKGLEGQRPETVTFTCKESLEDTDSKFIVSLEDTIDERSYNEDKDILSFVVRIPPYKTANLELGRYFYDLEMTLNGDVITLMIGRLSIEYEVHRSDTPDPPTYENGDDVEYPILDIPDGTIKLYTEQYISNIAAEIKVINGSEDEYTTQEMIAALEGIDNDIIDINSAINAITGSSATIALSDIADTITDELDIKYPSGEEVYY